MSDASSGTAARVEVAGSLGAAELFALLGGRGRWPIIRLMADGKPRTATDVAGVVGRDFDGVSKHMRLLREAGLLECRLGEDRRFLFFYMPERYRRQPGWLDFGICTVRMS